MFRDIFNQILRARLRCLIVFESLSPKRHRIADIDVGALVKRAEMESERREFLFRKRLEQETLRERGVTTVLITGEEAMCEVEAIFVRRFPPYLAVFEILHGHPERPKLSPRDRLCFKHDGDTWREQPA